MIKHIFVAVLVFTLLGTVFLHFSTMKEKFGRLPSGHRLERLQQSSNYDNGTFHNQSPVPLEMHKFNAFFAAEDVRSEQRAFTKTAPKTVPPFKTNLHKLNPQENVLIWLGNSSYYVQMAGKRIVIDPAFSLYAAPFFFMVQPVEGSSAYTAADIPPIDYLLISHDHWDHLDYDAVKALKSKVGQVICPLGVGEYFEQWGYDMSKVYEADWNEVIAADHNFRVYVLPAQHYSNRMLGKDKTLWASFALEGGGRRIYYGGDSGYGEHYKAIGERFGSFDVVILDSGQFDHMWSHVHMMPDEVVHATEDLHAKALLPGHIGMFSSAKYPWDEPFQRVAIASENKPFRLITPLVGAKLALDDEGKNFTKWNRTSH